MMMRKIQEGIDHMKKQDQVQANNRIHHSDGIVNMYNSHKVTQVDAGKK